MSQAITVLVLGIGTVLLGVGGAIRYLNRRLSVLELAERKTIDALIEERNLLQKRVAFLEEQVKKIPQMEARIQTLIDQLADMQKRLAETEKIAEERLHENDRLHSRNQELIRRVNQLEAQLNEKATELDAYKNALRLLGHRLNGGDSEKPAVEKLPSEDKKDEEES